MAATTSSLIPLGRVKLTCGLANYFGRQIFGVIPHLAYSMFLGQNWVLRSGSAVWGQYLTIKPRDKALQVPFQLPRSGVVQEQGSKICNRTLFDCHGTIPCLRSYTTSKNMLNHIPKLVDDTPLDIALCYQLWFGSNIPSEETLAFISDEIIPVTSPNARKQKTIKMQCQSTDILEGNPLGNQQQESSIKAFREEITLVLSKSDLLTQDEKESLMKLIMSFGKLFSLKPGRTDLVLHTIDTEDARPIHKNPYPVSFAKRAIIEAQVQEMLHDGIVQPSMSAWASPVVLVKKTDGSERFCVDYRAVNAITQRNRYPLPRMLDILHSLHGAKYLTTLDLTSGYWQVQVSPEDMPKTAFITHDGLYEFIVMPFGLSGAPGTFQRLMDHVLADLKYKSVFVYLDDIVIFSSTFTEHLVHLSEVFVRLCMAKLTVKLGKCHFCREEMLYLGHIIGSGGIQTNPQKLEAVAKFQTPTSAKDIQRFLGFAGWYRRHIPHYSQIAAPLSALVSPKKQFIWSKECETSFLAIKQALMSTTVLAIPDFTKPFVLQTDASTFGLGAVLAQLDAQKGEVIIEYASRLLRKAEKNYTVTELECLAVVWACLKFRCYVEGTHFTVITDHKALRWLRNARDLSGRLTRWSLRLQEFDFDIEYRKGSEHLVPDALSRSPVGTPDKVEIETDTSRMVPPTHQPDIKVLIAAIQSGTKRRDVQIDPYYDLSIEQDEDEELKQFKKYLCEHLVPTDVTQARQYRRMEGNYRVLDNILYFVSEDNQTDQIWRPVIPKHLQIHYLEASHDDTLAGHLGISKTYDRLRRVVFWIGMQSSVHKYVRTCCICQMSKADNTKAKGLMLSPSLTKPMQLWGIDLMGPFPLSHRGNQFVLVLVDYFSKWVEVFALRNSRAASIVRLVHSEVFCRWDAPSEILSDNGPQFGAKVFRDLCKKWNIRQKYTSPYHPQSDFSERINRILGTMMRSYVRENHRDWDLYLSDFAYAIRSARQDSTGFTPARIVLGRDYILPIARQNYLALTREYGNINNYIKNHDQTLGKITLQASKQQEIATGRQKRYYDSKHQNIEFNIGEKVWLRNRPQSNAGCYFMSKLAPKWIGPFVISKKLNPVNYVLHTENGRDHGFWHISDLKPVVEGTRMIVNQSPVIITELTDTEDHVGPSHRYNLRPR